jgi:hypothetical protein
MPTTPQENRQLLSLLSSSFQRRLDEAHPPIQLTEPLPQAGGSVSGPAMNNSSARATMDHLYSLLQHPLIAQSTAKQRRGYSSAEQAATMMDRAMLRGEADLKTVDRCMQVYMKTLHTGDTTVRDEFRLGRRLAAWFTSSNAAIKERFLYSPQILRNAVPILYADGLEEVVWEWLGMLYSRRGVDGGSQQQDIPQTTTKPLQDVIHEIHLTFLMIKEALRRNRLDAALLQFIQTSAYMSRTGRMSDAIRSSQPWQATTNAVKLALLRRRRHHNLSAQLFDRFMEHHSSWSDPDDFGFELISLYHPTRPSARGLAAAISHADYQVQMHFAKMKKMSVSAREIVLSALLDGAQLMLEQDSTSVKQAQLILDLVEKHFPNTNGVEGGRATRQRIQTVRQTINPQNFLSPPIGVT